MLLQQLGTRYVANAGGVACYGKRLFRAWPALAAKPLPPRPSIAESDIEEAFLKGSGPGGQKINKTSSAVQLKHIPTGIVVKSQATRSRTENRKIARRVMAEKLEQIEKGDQSRAKLKEERARKKKASKSKKAKRKYRALEEGKRGEEGAEEEDEDEDRGDDDETDVAAGGYQMYEEPNGESNREKSRT